MVSKLVTVNCLRDKEEDEYKYSGLTTTHIRFKHAVMGTNLSYMDTELVVSCQKNKEDAYNSGLIPTNIRFKHAVMGTNLSYMDTDMVVVSCLKNKKMNTTPWHNTYPHTV